MLLFFCFYVSWFVRSFGGYEKCPSHLNINFRLKRYMVGISRISERVCDTLAPKKTLPTKTSTINTFWISSKLYAKFCFSLGAFLDFWFLLLFYQFFAIAKVLVYVFVLVIIFCSRHIGVVRCWFDFLNLFSIVFYTVLFKLLSDCVYEMVCGWKCLDWATWMGLSDEA